MFGVRRLRVGDRVAVVAPAGPLIAERLEAGLAVLRSWGLEPTVMPAALDRHDRYDYLAGADAARAKDFRDAWLDPAYAAIWCARGGYGVQRMIDLLDLDELARHEPKLLVGFSDVTALHEAFNGRGIVTVHGPMVATAQFTHPVNAERLRALLFEPESVHDFLAGSPQLRTLVPGQAEGVLRGGNVALLAASIGTPTYDRPDGAIAVLEDVNEDMYRMDRLFAQLRRAGWFDGVTGVVLGGFTHDDAAPDDDLIAALVLDHLGDLGIPILAGAAVGHDEVNLAIPTGALATLDATAKTLTPKENPLR